MFEFERKLTIRNFIYDKVEKGYIVRKIGKDTYEFKIKTKMFDSIEKIHRDNFIKDFLK